MAFLKSQPGFDCRTALHLITNPLGTGYKEHGEKRTTSVSISPHRYLCVLLQKLTNVRIMKENMRTGNLPANMKKARVIQIIPCKMINFIYRNKSYKYMAVLRLL